MPSVTVNGSDGGYVVVNYDTTAYADLATTLLAGQTGYLVDAGGGVTIPEGSVVTGIGTTSQTSGVGPIAVLDASTAADQLILIGNGTTALLSAAEGAGTIIAGDGNDTFSLGTGFWEVHNESGNDDVLGGSGGLLYAGGTGDSTIVAGSGVVFGFGDTANDTYDLSTGVAVLVGGTGTMSVNGGSASFLQYFGTDGSTVDYAGGSGANVFVAGSGNETLNASGSSGANQFFAGAGDDSISAGSGDDTLLSGTGDSTLTGGAGSDLFEFLNQTTPSADTISDFSSDDKLVLLDGLTISDQDTSSGDLVVTLSDDTTITFSGITSDLTDSQYVTLG